MLANINQRFTSIIKQILTANSRVNLIMLFLPVVCFKATVYFYRGKTKDINM